jgi:2-polyprenyl-3-methyl-5-hydroxy-6-metoxy-1,4-benzoquinol methylase
VSSSSSYLDPVVLPLIVGESVLDVACGYGRWCHLIQSNYWEAGLSQPPVVDGFDAYEPNVAYCRRSGCYREIWQQALPSPLEGGWDTVLACEVIEHVRQEEVEAVVALLENVARRRIIFSTPNFPALRGGVDTFLGHNDYDAHQSYVPRSFFRSRGYRLKGAGWGNPRNPFVAVTTRMRLAPSLHSVPRAFPSLGETIVAVKDF